MIYVLIGKSCTGKDVIKRKLEQRLQLKPIAPYTTRPPRTGEKNDISYRFIDNRQLEEFRKSKQVIEERAYYTANGTWHYATILDEQFSSNGDKITIGTIESYLALKYFVGKDNVTPIYIHTSNDKRMKRMERREERQKNPNFKEMYRRFLSDNKAYSLENICSANLKYRFENNKEIDDCINEIVELIHNINKGVIE